MIKANEDDRRILYETSIERTPPWKTIKLLSVKQDSEVGNHYHKDKDELFILVEGTAKVTLNNVTTEHDSPATIYVNRGVRHVFTLSKGSKLLCLCSEEHNDNDDLSVKKLESYL